MKKDNALFVFVCLIVSFRICTVWAVDSTILQLHKGISVLVFNSHCVISHIVTRTIPYLENLHACLALAADLPKDGILCVFN